MSAQAELAFLSALRRGAASLVVGRRDDAARVRLEVNLRFNRTEIVTREIELHGPGEVTGFDARAVIREWPTRDVGDAAPNDMALVELDQADLPWRYTPLGNVTTPVIGKEGGTPPPRSDTNDRVHPWIVLIVLKQEEIIRYTPPTGTNPLPVLEVGIELPDLDQSWAWAHVQVAGARTLSAAEALQRFESAPHTLVARLLCPRRLEPRTAYRAFVIPSFERGRVRGLGRDPDDPSEPVKATQRSWSRQPTRGGRRDQPASDGPPAPIELPVYYEWEFQTASAGSDFESLARRLSAIALPPTVGTRLIDATTVDPDLPPASLQPLAIRGALCNPETLPPVWDPVEAAAFVPVLTELLNRPAMLLQGTGATTVAPPIYGRWLAADATTGDPPTAPWLDAINLDPRHRVAAGAGIAVVAKEEEALLTAAWEQIDGISEINEKLRFAQLSRLLTFRLRERSLTNVGIETLLAITQPVFARIRNGAQTTVSELAGSRLARGPLEPTFRRLTRPHGPLGRRIARLSGSAPSTLLSRMNSGSLVAAQTPPTPALLPATNTAPAPVAAVPPLPQFAIVREIGPRSSPPASGPQTNGAVDSADASIFRAAAVKMLASSGASRAQAPVLMPLQFAALRNVILNALDPAVSVTASLVSRLRFSEGFSRATTDFLEPIMAAPEFDAPMYEPLRDVSAEWILPSLGDVPNNSVSLAAVNPTFIESFMVGLNHEFARALLWRQYPTDQRCTFFRQFWDSSAYFGPRTPEELRDVEPLDAWPASGALGTNSSRPQLPGGAAPLVLVLHGDLLQQFPRAIVYAARAATVDGRKEPIQPADEMHPIFRGTLPGAFAFFGFELTADQARGDSANPDGWFFVLQEQPVEPRFGFEASGPVASPLKWSDLTWSHIAPAASPFVNLDRPAPNTSGIVAEAGEPVVRWHLADGTNSAQLAYIALRRPARVVIHATAMLKGSS